MKITLIVRRYLCNCSLVTWGACLGLATFACSSTHGADRLVGEYEWANLPADAQLLGGTPVSLNEKSVLRIINTNDAPLQMRILIIKKPSITKMVYGLTGEVKCEGLKGDAYLEMWNCFEPIKPGAEEGRYFTRTLGAPSQPMGKLTGSMSWRSCSLPFDRTGANGPPVRLELNVFLPGQGTIYLGALKLRETTGGVPALLTPANAWWGDQSAGLIGGFGGAFIGCFAGLLTWLASKGKARVFVMTSMSGLTVLGAILCIAAVTAVFRHQPYAVWFPLTLGGLILLTVVPYRLRYYQKQYHELELRRMNSIDALQG